MILGSGTVELRSGVWQWQLLGGERVRFLHFVMDGVPDNQMLRPLVSDATVDEATARRFASHPGTRVWVAPDGERWLVHDLSYLARARRAGPRELMLIRADGESLPVEVGDSLELGQLKDEELLELMWRAEARIRAETQAQAKETAKPRGKSETRTGPSADADDDEAADRQQAAADADAEAGSSEGGAGDSGSSDGGGD